MTPKTDALLSPRLGHRTCACSGIGLRGPEVFQPCALIAETGGRVIAQHGARPVELLAEYQTGKAMGQRQAGQAQAIIGVVALQFIVEAVGPRSGTASRPSCIQGIDSSGELEGVQVFTALVEDNGRTEPGNCFANARDFSAARELIRAWNPEALA